MDSLLIFQMETYLLDIAERAGLPFGAVKDASEMLLGHGLLKACNRSDQLLRVGGGI